MEWNDSSPIKPRPFHPFPKIISMNKSLPKNNTWIVSPRSSIPFRKRSRNASSPFLAM